MNPNPNQHIKTRSYANKQKNRRSSRFSRLPWLDKHQLLSCLYKQICCVSWCVWGWWLVSPAAHYTGAQDCLDSSNLWFLPNLLSCLWKCLQTDTVFNSCSFRILPDDIVCILLQMCCRTSGWRLDRRTERDAKQLRAKLKSEIPWFKWNSLSFFCDWSFS